MPRASFSAIKKALVKHDRDAILRLVGALYELSPQNRDFLDARFGAGDFALMRDKNIIHNALYPDVMSSDPVSVRTAKKTIADYRKALGEAEGVAELTIFAVECGNQFTCDFGDIDEGFYDSPIRLFDSAAEVVATLEPQRAKPFVARLHVVVDRANGIGWGYFDSIAAIFAESFPDASET